MFEVGKQYQGAVTGRVVEVVHVGNEKSFVRTVKDVDCLTNYPVGSEHTIDNDLFGDSWKLYVPPVVHAEEVFIKWHELSGFHIDDQAACFHDTAGTWLRGKLRLTYDTEGGKLTAEVLE